MNDRAKLTAIIIAACAVIIIACYSIVASVRADGRVEYCYIKTRNVEAVRLYSVMGFRPWREDRLLETTTTSDAAIAFASKLGCELR